MGGPPVGTVTYPYYTVRGPRDFLANDPPSIGPYSPAACASTAGPFRRTDRPSGSRWTARSSSGPVEAAEDQADVLTAEAEAVAQGNIAG